MHRGGEWSRTAALVTLTVVAACSKPDAPREVVSTSPRILPGLGAPPASAPAEPAPTSVVEVAPRHEPFQFDGAVLPDTITEVSEAAAAAPLVDPDQAIVQAARVSASACFAGLQGGPDVQTAIVEVTVVPTGWVSRSAVSAPALGREVVDCLTRVGNGLHFSSKDDSHSEGIRSFSIDVTVARHH